MGGASSSINDMSQVDFESYKGIRYTHEVPNSREPNRGPIYFSKTVYTEHAKQTLYHNFLVGLAIDGGNRPLYGARQVVNGRAGPYEWITYREAHDRFEAIASGLTHFARLQRSSMVGIMSKNRIEWCLTAHACDRQAYTLVPLYDTLGPDAVPYIVNQTELTTLVFAAEQFNVVMECKNACPTLQYLIQYEDVSAEQRRVAAEKGVQLKSLREIEALGASSPVAADLPLPEDVATICYTSGTTGNPKGVMVSHKNMTVSAAILMDRIAFNTDVVHLSFLPLPHVFERAMVTTIVRTGGCVGFFQGDVLHLLDDAAELKPTIFISVPRLLNRVYDKVMQSVSAAGGLKKLLFDQAYAAKKAGLSDGHKTHAMWDALVFSKIRMVLGGRVGFIISGAAPLSGEVKEFFKIAFSCDMLEGYGLSETAAAITVAAADHPLGKHVGPPLPNMEFRLEDVPEMGYTSNDKPRPRGEILCRGDVVFSGYYKEPEKTSEALDKDGWFHTGDVGCWNADGTLSIIDRKKNIFKLSQGEYVSAEKIENILLTSKYIAQIFVYGDSFQSVLVAVAVPDPEIAEAWGAGHGLSVEESTVAKLVNNTEFYKDVMADVDRVGKEAQLRGFEMIKRLHLTANPFSVDAELITPTFKLKRPQLKAYFQPQISEMYASLK